MTRYLINRTIAHLLPASLYFDQVIYGLFCNITSFTEE
jgi:hypothetical protein